MFVETDKAIDGRERFMSVKPAKPSAATVTLAAHWKWRRKVNDSAVVQSVRFVVFLNTAALSCRKPTSAWTSRDNVRATGTTN